MNKRRLLKLATFLATVPRRSFEMELFIASPATNPEGKRPGDCGFAGCALGWAAHAKLFRGLSVEGANVVYRRPHRRTREFGFTAGASVFDIDIEQSEALFDPFEYRPTPEIQVNVTPAVVARRIRKFVETGRIA